MELEVLEGIPEDTFYYSPAFLGFHLLDVGLNLLARSKTLLLTGALFFEPEPNKEGLKLTSVIHPVENRQENTKRPHKADS